ncbi:MAG: hypothetical protein CMJ31_11695, partial [Phycisphaerae bacterium]|nr:hypothetical protein [Phycisphaerae bacterium]
LRAAQGEPALNFASPWKPVDRSARTRQLVLAGVFGLIILGGLGWLWADGAVRSITRQIDPITKEAKGLKSRYDERQIELGAWRHLDAWARPEVDWLAHLDRVTDAMTPPPDMLLTEISGRMEAAPTFKPGQPLQDAASWAHVQRGTIRLSGLAADRDLTQSLRANLLASPTYAVHARGPETDGAFQLELTTPDTTPIDPPTPASDEVGSSR